MIKKSILFFVNNLNQTGSETLVFEYLQDLNRRGHFHISVCLIENRGLLVDLLDSNIEVYQLNQEFTVIDKLKNQLGIPVLANKFNEILDSVKPDICYFNTISSVFLLDYVRHKSFKIVVHLHELLYNFELMASKEIENLLSKTDAIIACSSLVQDLFEKIYSKPVHQIHATIKPVSCISKKQITDQIKILSSGTICYRKGTDVFLEIAEKCKDQNFEFIWLGKFPNSGFAEIIKRKSAYIKHLKFVDLENRSDYLAQFIQADLFLSTSREESMGLVINEAISMGIPVVATNSGGSKLMTNSHNAIIVDSFNPQILADEVIQRSKNLSPIETHLKFDFDIELNKLEKILLDL